MMRRLSRGGLPLAFIALSLCACPATCRAGAVVMLRSGSLAPYVSAAAGVQSALRGEAIDISMEDAPPSVIERRIVTLRPDAVVAVGLKAALFARDRLPKTPIVYCVVQNAETQDLDGNWITGVSIDVPPGDALRALATVSPAVRRIGVFYGRKTGASFARAARVAAAAAGLSLVEVPLDDLSNLPEAARAAVGRVDALWMPADPTIAVSEAFRFLLELSISSRRPLLAFSDALVRSGALVAVAPDYSRAGMQTVDVVRRIQAGERPGDIAIAPLRGTRVIVNAATARALGLSLPAEVERGAEVIR